MAQLPESIRVADGDPFQARLIARGDGVHRSVTRTHDLGVSIAGTHVGHVHAQHPPQPFSLAPLQVSEGGVIRKPLWRLAPGVWEFALASAEGSGHSSVSVSVRIDGVVIGSDDASLSGARELPVGPDAWLAFGSVRAYGGCDWSGAPMSASAPRSAWLFALITVGWRWRMRQRAGLARAGLRRFGRFS